MTQAILPPSIFDVIDNLARRVELAERRLLTEQTGIIPTGSALPGTPTDGQEFNYLLDATQGIVWRFRYRSTSTSSYKWEFVGGAPLYRFQGGVTNIATPTANVYSATGSPPSYNLPFAGDYLVRFGSPLLQNHSASAGQIQLAPHLAGVLQEIAYVIASVQFNGAGVSSEIRLSGAAANATLSLLHASFYTSRPYEVRNLWFEVSPVRIG